MLTFSIKRENVYLVSFKDVKLGEIGMLDDGVYYYFPYVITGAISGWVLLKIYQKLEELNYNYNKKIDNYINLKQ